MIGIPDTEYGESTCAVVKFLNGKTKEKVIEHVVGRLGRQYTLDRVMTLEELRLTEFPVNRTFKIVRSSVQQAAVERLGR